MPINVPMYQPTLRQFSPGGIVNLGDSSRPVAGLEEALRLASANKQQGIENSRQGEQDLLTEELARAQLELGGRRADISERQVAQREASTDATERYRQGYLKMQTVKALMGQYKADGTQYTPQEVVEIVNKQFSQPQPAQPSTEPPQYQPEPGAARSTVKPGIIGRQAPTTATPTAAITQTATNPQTGERIGWNGKQWIPLP